MSIITQKKLSNLDRIKISLEVLDGLKARAVKMPSSGSELNDLGQTFGQVRHGLENDVRAFIAQIEVCGMGRILAAIETELEQVQSELGARDMEASPKVKGASA